MPDFSNKTLGSIHNSDMDNVSHGVAVSRSGRPITADEYRYAAERLLEHGPNVLAQNVGLPDTVNYRTDVATTFDKHFVEVFLLKFGKDPGRYGFTGPEDIESRTALRANALRSLLDAGTDPLALTVEVCRARGVHVLASYRMNSEDLYEESWRLSDFGRAHPEWRIPGTSVLDYAVPQVFEHRMAIFREVVEKFDVDGIEFDWRRHCRMVSDPTRNHAVLTRLVRQTREMLDEAAQRRGRARMLLGVRVCPMLYGEFVKGEWHGASFGTPTNASCEGIGLDVETWINEGLVDYVCPSLFWPKLPGLPDTARFVSLTRDRNVGVYPTVFPLPPWAEKPTPMGDLASAEAASLMRTHRDDLCRAALHCYDDGADGISTYNWYGHTLYYHPPSTDRYRNSIGYNRTLMHVHRALRSPEALRACLESVLRTNGECRWET